MGYAKYVGRVGALAVALGIGTAVANPAWADTQTNDTETSSTGVTSTRSRATAGPDRPTGPSEPTISSDVSGLTTKADEEDEVQEAVEEMEPAVDEESLDETAEDVSDPQLTESIDDEDEPRAGRPTVDDASSSTSNAAERNSSVTPSPVNRTRRTVTSAQDRAQATSSPEASPVADSVETVSVPEARTVMAQSPSTTYQPLTADFSATEFNGAPAPASVVQQPKTPLGLVLGGPVAMLDIAVKALNMLFSPAPTMPGDPPLLLGVLAFVRREVNRTFFNSSPTAVGDVTSTSEGVPTRISVLDNDSDPNAGDVLTVTKYTQAANGVVSLNSDGGFTYTPNAGYLGTDTFTYQVSDEASPWHVHSLVSVLRGGHGSTATVTVTVDPVENQTPSVDNDSTIIAEDTPIVIDVLANDTDPDTDTLTISGVGTPSHGTAVITDGKITYTPTTDYHGDDTFTYTVTDGQASSTATVTITVTPTNDAPVANNDTFVMPNGSTDATINVVANDTDAEGDSLSVAGVAGVTNGTATFAGGTVTYTPEPGYTGVQTLTYTVFDGTLTDTATLTITVPAVVSENHAPVPGDSAYSIVSVDKGSGKVTGTINATDPDAGDILTYLLSKPVDTNLGKVEIDSITGTFAFTPTAQARLNAWLAPSADPVTFGVIVSDGELSTQVNVAVQVAATVRFIVSSVAGDEEELGNQGLAVGADGRLYITTYQVDNTGELIALNPDGTHAATIDIASVIPHLYSTAYDVVVAANGKVYVSGETGATAEEISGESGQGVVVVVDPDDDYSVALFAETTAPASALAVDKDGRVYVGNWTTDTITVFDADGTLVGSIDSGELLDGDDTGVAGLAVDSDGRLFLTKPMLGIAKVVNIDGSVAGTSDLGGQPWAVAFDAKGAAYVTDLAGGMVAVLGPDGVPAGTINLGDGAAPFDVTVTADDRVYVLYAAPDGRTKIAEITAIPVAEPEETGFGAPVAGVPVALSGLVVGTNVVYQTVANVDSVTGAITTTVSIIAADGTATPVRLPGLAVGSPVLSVDEALYQTVRTIDANTGTISTGVVKVAPDSTVTFSGFSVGSPVGGLVLGPDGIAYQVALGSGDDDTFTTTVIASGPTGTRTYDISGASPLNSSEPANTVVSPEGTAYVTTIDFGSGADEPSTTVTVITSAGTTTHRLGGLAGGPVTIAADGTVFQTVAFVSTAPDVETTPVRTAVAVLTDTGFTTLPFEITGFPVGGIQVAADGALYQAVVDYGADDPTTTIAAVTPSGLSPVLEDLPGSPLGAGGKFIPVVVGDDGTVYQTTSFDPGSVNVVTRISSAASGVVEALAEVAGQPVGAMHIGPGGTVYQTTYDADADVTHVIVITPSGTTDHEFSGIPATPQFGAESLTGPVIGPDGNAYQTILFADPSAGGYVTTVAVVSPYDLATPSVSGAFSGPVVFSHDGTGYLTIESFDVGTQSAVTKVVNVTAGGLTPVGPPISGQAAGPAVIGPDGTAYQSVVREVGAGGSMTSVHVVSVGASAPAVAMKALSGIGAAATAAVPLTAFAAAASGSVRARSAKLDGELFLGGKYIELGVSSNGSFGTSGTRPTGFYGGNDSRIGLAYDLDGFGTGIDKPIDVYLPGTPEERWSVGYTPVIGLIDQRYAGFSNLVGDQGNAASLANTSLENKSSGNNLVGVFSGTVSNSLKVTQTYSFNANDSSYKTTVTIQNVSGGRLENIEFMRSFDPDNTVYQNGDFYTDNTIGGQLKSEKYALVTATSLAGDPYNTATGERVTSYIISSDPNAVVYNGGFSNANPYDWDTGQASGYYDYSDSAIGIVFKLGAMASGESKTFTYYTGVTTNGSGAEIAKQLNIATTKAAPPSRVLDKTSVGVTGNLWKTVRALPPNGFRVDIVKSATDNRLKVIAYFGGTAEWKWLDPASMASWLRNIPAASNNINYSSYLAAIKQASWQASSKNNGSPEIALVGYSQGGLDAQNIAFISDTKNDKYLNVTTLVTFASPINHSDSSGYKSAHLRAEEDPVPKITISRPLPIPGVYFSNSVFSAKTGLGCPLPGCDVHSREDSYLTVANDFTRSTDGKFRDVKDHILRFKGSMVLAAANQLVLPTF